MRSVLLLAALAVATACSAETAPPELDPAAAAHGRAERAFWTCYDRGRKSLGAGDESAAREAYAEALEHKPEHAASLYALAGIEHRARRHARALELARRLERVDRPKTRALLLIAAIQSDVEHVAGAGAGAAPDWFDLAAAAEAAARAEKINPEETGPHLMRARLALLRDDPDGALESLARLLALHPAHGAGLVLRVVAHERAGRATAAQDALAAALRATAPADPRTPTVLGDGDTRESLARRTGPTTDRLRVLACLLRLGGADWPADAPPRPPEIALGGAAGTALAGSLAVRADFDGDGDDDELTARRAAEPEALRSLFGLEGEGDGSFRLTLAGRDATLDSGLMGHAACVGSLAVVNTGENADGRADVLVRPGAGEPARQEPPILLRNLGRGRFEVLVTR